MKGSDPQPSGFSRADLDRVIRRAVELQFEQGADRGSGEDLNEEEIRRIGAEVGIDDRFLRQALGEVRAESLLPELPPESGFLSWMVGGSFVRTHRVVPGSVTAIEARLGEHLRVAETLSPVRNRHGRSLWEPERGVLADLRRGLRWRGYRYELARISNLEVSVSRMEEGFVLVSLAANLRRPRAEGAVGYATGVGATSAAAGLGVGVALGAPLLAIPGALVGALVGIRASRGSFRTHAGRILLTMEGILDRLETGKSLASKPAPSLWRKLPPAP